MQNLPSTFVPASPSTASSIAPRKDRGGLMLVMLTLTTLGSAISTFAIVLGGAKIDQLTGSFGSLHTLHHDMSRLVLALTIFQLAHLASVMAMWAWQRMGVVGYFACGMLMHLTVYKLTGDVSILGVGWLLLMGLAVFPRLHFFD